MKEDDLFWLVVEVTVGLIVTSMAGMCWIYWSI
jgi:hypothetical protein